MATFTEIAGAIATSGVVSTADTLYDNTATSGYATTFSTITITNTSASAQTFSLATSTTTSFVTSGYIAKEVSLAAGEFYTFTIGLTLTTTRRYLLVSGSAATVVASYFGVLKTP